MRYRIKDYKAKYTNNVLELFFNSAIDIETEGNVANAASTRAIREAVRLVVDETIGGSVLCSTGAKSNLLLVRDGGVTGYNCSIVFNIDELKQAAQQDGDIDEVNALNALTENDEFTIEVDYGDNTESLIKQYDEMISMQLSSIIG